jgi:hypothetical protein
MNEDGVWHELLQNNYLHSKSLAEVKAKPLDSPFWKGLMRVKEDFLCRGSFIVDNGQNARFWEDVWLGNKPLAEQYPFLYNIVRQKQVSVANMLNQNPVNITFRRTLLDNHWFLWLQLVERLMNVHINNEKYVFVWSLRMSRNFSVKYVYLDWLYDGTKFL